MSIRAVPITQTAPLAGRSAGRGGPAALLGACQDASVALLAGNSVPEGVLAAAPGERAQARSYTAIFGRDAAICALGMVLSGDQALAQYAAASLTTLAAHQAPNGQIPKFVTLDPPEADFWYVGCIDATLWWLLALAFLKAHGVVPAARHGRAARLALLWLTAQEHPRFKLLQQNEASDWADIMPRSGFVLYTNALWYLVKRIYRQEGVEETRRCCNSLLHPFSAAAPDYRRERLMAEHAKAHAQDRELYLSFINFMAYGDEGDVLGNLLAILCGLTGNPGGGRRILAALERAGVHEPYPVRAVVRPIGRGSPLWRPYMARHRQNLPWQYHNGGIWPMIGGFWVAAQVACGRRPQARAELVKLAQSCQLGGWAFNEWLQGRSGALRGMPGQSWNAAGFLMAQAAVASGESPFAVFFKRT